jgi:hypothetical protein
VRMSIPVSLDALRDEISRFGFAYLLTVSADDRPHSTAVTVQWDADELVVPAGNRTVANATDRPLVSLVWPPTEDEGFSLIVDADATSSTTTADGKRWLRLRPTSAVLHRPASSGGSDCVPVFQSDATSA